MGKGKIYAGVILLLLCLNKSGLAQQLRLGSNPYTVEKSAVLELVSDNQGLLLPRISDTSLINTLNPPDGMVIFFIPTKKLLFRTGGYWVGLAQVDSIVTSVNGNTGALTLDTNYISNFHTKVRSLFSAVAPITFSNGQIGISQATASTNGYLSSTDWNTFNNKVSTSRTISSGFGLSGGGDLSADRTFIADSLLLSTRYWRQKGLDSIAALIPNITGKLNISDTASMLSVYLRGASAGYGMNISGSQHKTWTVDSTLLSTRYNRQKGLDSLAALMTSGTVTSVAALTLGTAGTDLSSSVANSTTTPVITLNVPTASASNRGVLSSTDWSTFNNKVSTSRTISTGYGLSGGGDLSANRTLTADTLLLSSLYNRQKGLDSLAALIPGVSGKLNISDTASMLSAYLRGSTAGYGINISGSQHKTWTADSTLLSTRYNRQKGLDSLAALITSSGTVTSIATTSPITGGTITSSGTIGITQATTSTDGYLNSTDWNTFNNKVSTSRTISTGYGLSGGGDLSANRTLIADTLLLSSLYNRQKGLDSLAALIPSVSGKLNISDTASMLSAYLRGATAGYGINISGTQHKTWTVDSTLLSTRYNRQKGLDSLAALIPSISGKLNISDTASMLSNYLRGATEGWGINISGSQHKTWTSDSLEVASWYRLYKPVDSLGGIIATKVATSRTINTTSPITGGGDLSADRTIAINNAAADGSTKGAASFTAADFDASSGNISIDYTNGQAASGSSKGFLTSTDWTTFNNKQPAGNYLTDPGANGIVVRIGLNNTTNRSITGTTDRISVSNGSGISGDPTIDISSSYVGQNSITTLGTITTGTWNGTVIGATYGGTGQSTYTTGDMLYASSSTALSKLAAVAAGSYLRSAGTSTAPVWSTATLPNSATTGDLLYASAGNTYSNLAGVATGNALISGGVSTAPSWGKIGLTTHVSGTLPIANGGTNSATALNNNRIMVSSGGAIVEAAAMTNGQLLIGSTSAAPVAATLTAGNGIVITNAAGSITIANEPTISQATGTSTVTTSSTTDVALSTALSVTPGAGDYLVFFTGDVSNSNSDRGVIMSIYVNGSKITASEVMTNSGSGGDRMSLATNAYITGVGAGQAIEMRWRVDANTGTITNRTLIVQRVK